MEKLRKKNFENPYEKSLNEKIDFRGFRVDIHQKIKIFGMFVKLLKKISLQKKLFFRSNIDEIRSKKRF